MRRLSPDLLSAIRAGACDAAHGRRTLAPEIERLRQAGALGVGLEASGSAEELAAAGQLLFDLGGASLPLARLIEGHLNAVDLARRLATSDQRPVFEARLARGELWAVWGADLGSSPLVARRVQGAWVLEGGKKFASGLGLVDRAVLSASTGSTTRLFLCPVADGEAAPERWTMNAMRATRSGEWRAVPERTNSAEPLGDEDAWFAEPGFYGGLWRLVAAYAGAMMRLAALGDEAARGRGDGEIARHRAGGLLIEAETARLWAEAAREATIEADRAGTPAAARAAAQAGLMARDATSEAAFRLLDGWARLAGTARFAEDSEAGLLARDLDLFLRQADPDGKRLAAVDLWRTERASSGSVC